MTDALYLAMAGAKQTMIAQTVNANNLANVSTPGFRADLFNANRVSVQGDTFNSDVYVTSEQAVSNFAAGTIKTTGRDLDIAINGEGWLAVSSADGKEAYTRAGSLFINEAGQLFTATGQAVLGNGGPISIPPAEQMTIANDGTITIRPIGQDATILTVVDRIKLVNPDNSALSKGKDGLFYSKNGAQQPADASVQINSQALESSNVSGVDAMINIISLARQFEMQVKMMQQTDSNGQALAQLLQNT